jgi:hypothetical protein
MKARRFKPAGFFLALPAAALQAINGYQHVGPLEHLDQLVKDALVIVWSGLQIFFQDALRVAHGLKG